jgi:Ca2+-binding EF-hand superfamily protein
MPTAHDAGVPNRSPPSTASAHYDRASLFEKLSRQSGQIRQILERAGTRSVCPEDFRNAVRSLGHSEQSDEAIDRCFAALDEDEAGVLSIDDIFDRLRPYVRDPRKKRVFLPLGGSRGAGTKLHIPPNSRVPDAAIEQLRELLRANRIRVLDHFHAWDEDRPRPEAVATKISATDFRRALAVLGLRATSEAVDALFRRFDCDYSGFLDYRELKDILRPSTPSPTKRSPSLTKRSPSPTKRSPSPTKRSPGERPVRTVIRAPFRSSPLPWSPGPLCREMVPRRREMVPRRREMVPRLRARLGRKSGRSCPSKQQAQRHFRSDRTCFRSCTRLRLTPCRPRQGFRQGVRRLRPRLPCMVVSLANHPRLRMPTMACVWRS